MTINGINVDGERIDETRDYVREAGALARGDEPDPSAPVERAHLRAIVDEVGGALLMAHDTFRDMERVHRVVGRFEMAEACRIAKEHAAGILARLEA